MKICLDCNCEISKKSVRCKSCANKHRWKNKNDPRRKKLIERNKKYSTNNLYEDRDWLYKRYVIEQKSIQKIATETNTSKRTIARWLSSHNIKTRSGSQSIKLAKSKKEKSINLNYVCDCGNRKSYKAKKCSKCYNKSGENNPNYKGIYQITTTVRTWSKKYWRPKVLERDGFVCKKCGELNSNLLEAHHINSLSNLIKSKINLYDNISSNKFELCQNLISDKDIQNIENGITLCKLCHRELHTKNKVSKNV